MFTIDEYAKETVFDIVVNFCTFVIIIKLDTILIILNQLKDNKKELKENEEEVKESEELEDKFIKHY